MGSLVPSSPLFLIMCLNFDHSDFPTSVFEFIMLFPHVFRHLEKFAMWRGYISSRCTFCIAITKLRSGYTFILPVAGLSLDTRDFEHKARAVSSRLETVSDPLVVVYIPTQSHSWCDASRSWTRDAPQDRIRGCLSQNGGTQYPPIHQCI